MLTTVMSLISKFAVAGGSLWLLWGAIILAGALKDKNGPDMKAGVWQIIGGAMIIAAAAYFSQITVA